MGRASFGRSKDTIPEFGWEFAVRKILSRELHVETSVRSSEFHEVPKFGIEILIEIVLPPMTYEVSGLVPNGPERSRTVPSGPELSRTVPNGSERFRTVLERSRTVPSESRTVPNVPEPIPNGSERFRTVPVRTAPGGTSLGREGLSWLMSPSPEQSQRFRTVPTRPFGTVRNRSGPLGTVRDLEACANLSRTGPDRHRSEPFVRNRSERFGTVRNRSGPFGTVRDRSGPFGTVRNCSGPFGTVLWTIQKSQVGPRLSRPFRKQFSVLSCHSCRSV